MTRRSIKNSDEAEALALEVVQFVLADEVLRGRFISITGIMPIDLGEAIHNKEFLGGVLDFLLGNEGDLLRCCEEYQVNPEQPSIARRLLPGYTNSY